MFDQAARMGLWAGGKRHLGVGQLSGVGQALQDQGLGPSRNLLPTYPCDGHQFFRQGHVWNGL